MSLAPGTHLGTYEILALIGSGGMGEVYRARDPRLNRVIAIKTLTEGRASGEERRARFTREAQSIASLNHPNIVTIHSVEEADGLFFFTMELVDGKPLNHVIAKSSLSLAQILRLAISLADAIGAAHQKGVTHRDLKPANVMVTAEGRVKVLDFGLAKLLDASAVEADVTTFPTAVTTGEGRIVGTVSYMSPEQAEGKPIDHRSDLFSFGVLLYEMATGERPFKGDTSVSTITSILRDTPRPITDLNRGLPREFARIVRRCLAKDVDHRYQDAKDLRSDLEDLQHDLDSGDLAVGSERAQHGVRSFLGRSPRLVLGAGLLIATLGGLAGVRWATHTRAAGAPVGGGRLSLLVSSEGEARAPALSADGKTIVYVAGNAESTDLYLSRVAGGERIRLTNDAMLKDDPAFSPDGERIVFSRRNPDRQSREICLIRALGGQTIPIVSGGRFPAWSPDSARLAFVLRQDKKPEALATAAIDGSDVRILLTGDETLPFLLSPAWSPDGRQIAIARSAGGSSEEIWSVPAAGGPARRMWEDPPGIFSGDPVFTADGRGLVHTSNRGGAQNLWYMPTGGGVPVRLTSGPGPDESPSVARTGAIAFVNSRSRALLVVHRFLTGETTTLFTHYSQLWAPAFSPDGKDIAFSRHEPDGSWHIWTIGADGGLPRQVTSSRVPEIYPRFMPDGSGIVFQTWGDEPRRIWRVARGGGPAVALTEARTENDEYADISPDGRSLAFARTEHGTAHVYIAPVSGGVARRLTDAPSTTPRWSPDGQVIAFSPDRTFRAGIWTIRVDGTAPNRLTSSGGWPVWWPDGSQIGYQDIGPRGTTEIAVVPIAGGPPKFVTPVRYYGNNYPFDISPDGTLLVTTNGQHVNDEIWILQPSQ